MHTIVHTRFLEVSINYIYMNYVCNGFVATYFLVLCLVFPLPNVEPGVSPSISAVNSCVS